MPGAFGIRYRLASPRPRAEYTALRRRDVTGFIAPAGANPRLVSVQPFSGIRGNGYWRRESLPAATTAVPTPASVTPRHPTDPDAGELRLMRNLADGSVAPEQVNGARPTVLKDRLPANYN